MNSVEEILFRLRFNDGHLGVPDNQEHQEIERLRPFLRSDERVRYALTVAILEAEYLTLELRMCLELLLDECPQSPQAKYLLRMHAYEHRGEDAMGTYSARKLMCERGLADDRLKREIEQTAFKRCEYIGQDLYHDFVMKRFWEWAHESAKYLPWILGDVVLNYTSVSTAAQLILKHLAFPLQDYDLGVHANEMQCRLAAGEKGPSPANLIRALKLDGVPTRAIYEVQNHAPVESWSPDDFDYIAAIAANHQDPFHDYARSLIIRTVDFSPLAMDWVRRQLLETPDDRTIHYNLASQTQDPELAQKSLQVLADRHGEFSTVINAISRFAHSGKPFPEKWAVRMLVRADERLPQGSKGSAFSVLQSLYPDHKETKRLFNPSAPAGSYAPLPKEFEPLLALASTSNDYRGGWALGVLAKDFLDRPEVKALLIQKASQQQHYYSCTQALKALAFHLADAPETMELLTRRLNDPWLSDLQRKLINHRSLQPDTFDQLQSRRGTGDAWPKNLAVPSLALWYGDRPETFDMIAAELPTLVQRWPDDPRTFAVLRQALIDGDGATLAAGTRRTVEAARLLSRAFSKHPETPELLRQHLNYRPEILSEYLGLHIGQPEGMEEGISVLRELADSPAHTEMAKSGPKLLIQFFGPHIKLLDALQNLRSESPCSALRKSIAEIFATRFPNRA